jgi:hypothetical protein
LHELLDWLCEDLVSAEGDPADHVLITSRFSVVLQDIPKKCEDDARRPQPPRRRVEQRL